MEQKNNKNHKQDLAIVRLEGRVNTVEDDIAEIKNQITNHIPGQMEKISNKVDGINNKILYGFVIMIAASIIIQIITKAF